MQVTSSRAGTTHFFQMTPTPLLTALTVLSVARDDWNPRNDDSIDLFDTEENDTMIQRQGESTELDYDVTPRSTLHFGPESYLTPQRSVKDCALSLNPPLISRKISHCDRKKCKRIRREGHNALHQTTSIIIPSLKLEEDNQASSPLSPKMLSFKLLPRAERVYNSPPRLRVKSTLRDTLDFRLRRQNRNTTKDGPLLENIQVNIIKLKPMKRSHSFTAMSA